MTRKTISDYADDSVRWTGIPALAMGHPGRRRLRWSATLSLAAALGGFVLLLVDRRFYPIGFSVLMLGFSVSVFVQMLGPLKPIGTIEGVDEWDRAIRDRSFVFAYTVTKITLPIVLILIGGVGAALTHWDLARLQQVVMALGFLMMAIFSALPTAHASWTMRPLDDD